MLDANGHGAHNPNTMKLRTSFSTLIGIAALVAAPSAFACGGDKDDDDTDEPSVLCGGDKDDDDTDEPS